MARRWNPALHPRDDQGRFTNKPRVSVRVNMNSASVQVGKTMRISPKYQVYAGALLRIERTAPNKLQEMLEKMTNQALTKVAESIPNNRIRNVAMQVIERRGRAEVNGVRINATSGRKRSPAVTASLARGKRAVSGQRAPRRKPRTRSAERNVKGRKIA